MLPFALKALGILVTIYLVVVILAWRYQDRLAMPSPRMRLPAPAEAGIPDGRRVTLRTEDGVTLYGWYLPPASGTPRPAPGLLWFYGNLETVAALAPILAEWKPGDMALLAIDYRGYGESEGEASEAGLYRDGEAAWSFLASQPDVDSTRIAAYGRSLGSAVALRLALQRPVRAVVLDSPFSNAVAMARHHYWFLPPGLVRLELDNVSLARRLSAPLLVVHGTDDRVAPLEMGRAVAAAGRGRLIELSRAGHNDTYDRGGAGYRDTMAAFLRDALR
jgi:dipeptidyl aminopeptidase/acylaminoacyl peptidase